MTETTLLEKSLTCDICVIGGGPAGFFAALEAARNGAKGAFNRETGLISELEERNIAGNPTLVHALFDATCLTAGSAPP